MYTYNVGGSLRVTMQATKSEILAHIKRSGGSSVDELATALGLARMTVRQHLANLERDGLIASKEVRRRTGRPHYVFTLSDKGHELFPKRYDRLADLLLQEVASLEVDEIAGLTAAEKKKLLLSKVVKRLAQEHAATVEGKSLPERVALVADILQREGGFAEWHKREDGFEIIDYNCVYRKVVETHNDFCEWHVSLLSQLLGKEVKCSQFMSRGADCCRFVVEGH